MLIDPEKKAAVEVWCKRDDLLHAQISGNKWRKLAKPLQGFLLNKPKHILSFGGPYSNHLHALSFCCQALGIPFTAVIRGEYLQAQALNPTLQDLCNWNTKLVFVTKDTYAKRNEEAYLAQISEQLNVDVIIPEGGSQEEALDGMQTMLNEIEEQNSGRVFDAIILPVGSGASMAGIVEHCRSNIANNIIGIASLKGETYLEALVQQFLTKPSVPWHINHNFHFGGYAKAPAELISFCQQFNEQQSQLAHSEKDPKQIQKELTNKDTPICIEPTYSGKCFYGAATLIQQGYFKPGSKILIIHTGGLQGNRS